MFFTWIKMLIALLMMVTYGLHAQPDKIWATYFGDTQYGYGGDDVDNIAYSREGSVYVVGLLQYDLNTAQLATPGSFLDANAPGNAHHAFVSRFDTAGNLLWCTYLHDGAHSFCSSHNKIAVDQEGNVLVTGIIQSFPGLTYENLIGSPGTYCPDLLDCVGNDFFSGQYCWYYYLLKIDSTGQKVWGTYLANDDQDGWSYRKITQITTDEENNILLCGWVNPIAIITNTGPAGAPSMGFLTKFSPDGNMIWDVGYGGGNSGLDTLSSTFCFDMACSPSGDIYVAGRTNATDSGVIATANATYPEFTPSATGYNGYLAKFNDAGQRLWSTYTPYMEWVGGVVADGEEGVYALYVVTSDKGIGTSGVHQEAFGGGLTDLALTRWTGEGQKLWGTYYGGSDDEFLGRAIYPPRASFFQANCLSMDDQGRPVIVGGSLSNDNPPIGCTYQPLTTGGLIAKFYPNGTIMWSSGYDISLNAVSCGPGSDFYISSYSDVNNLTTPGAYQPTKSYATYFFSKMSNDYICPTLDENLSLEDNEFSISGAYQNYQWYYHNGVIIADANSPTFTATDTGLYYVRFSDSCNCPQWSDTLAYPPPTAIHLVSDKEPSFTVYPNPATHKLYLSGSLPWAGEAWLRMVDITGKTLLQQQLSITGGIFKAELDISALPAGLYLLRITSAGKTGQVKWVKQDR